MRFLVLVPMMAALIVVGGCESGPDACGYPPSQGPTEPCCLDYGADACGAGFFCAAFDGRTIPTCYANGSRLGGESCTSDGQCSTMSCNTTAGACRFFGGSDCTSEIGCAPLMGARRACGERLGVRDCWPVGDGTVGALCGDSTDCNSGLRCDLMQAQCAPCDRGTVTAPTQLDLLFVVDNANGADEEQAALAAALPGFVGALASGDRDGDGVLDFTPPASVHLGVITTDMGSAGFDVLTCGAGTLGVDFGDDGRLITRGSTSAGGCSSSYPAVLEFAAGANRDVVASSFSCVAATGTGGCGVQQPLEAMLKAVSPSTPQTWTTSGYAPPTFHRGTFGHGSDANAGFLREGSALGIVVLTYDVDTSLRDPDLLNPSSSRYTGDLSLRGYLYPDALHPIERYVAGSDGTSGLIGLRRSADQLLFTVIAGVPPDAITDPSAPDFDAILAHRDMQQGIDPSSPSRLSPSCSAPGRGTTFPPRRLVQVARGLAAAGARVSVGSSCAASYSATLDALLRSLTEAPGCL